VRSGEHLMGDEFTSAAPPALSVRLIGTAPFSKVVIVRDGHEVYSTEPKTKDVAFEWQDTVPPGAVATYYYVRGEQADGQLVWTSPMWIGSMTGSGPK